MNTLKKLRLSALILMMGSLVMTSCSDDDEEDTPPAGPTVIRITQNTTWAGNQIHELNGRTVVESGATLTIEPGAIIKASGGQGTAASALIIARGAKIDAQGTATNPIIFTSATDNIQVGQLAGTNLLRNNNQLWGGIIILGDAPTSAENGDTETNIEGLPAEASYGLYGGDNPNDDSGIMNFVSIRHGGISIGEGNEINGLTLGGVGDATVITNIEVYATLDDGIECFGGTVNVTNALVYYQGDDGIDLDMNYSGTIENFAVIHGDGIGTDESLEIDGPEGSTYTDGQFTLMNGICRLEGNDGSLADFKSRAQGFVENVTFDAAGSQLVKFRTRFDDNCTHRTDAYSHLVLIPDTDPNALVFTQCLIPGINVYDGDVDDDNPAACPTELAAAQIAAAAEVTLAGSGSNLDLNSVFGWTLAGQRGQL